MSKEVVVYKSLLPYYVIAFVVLVMWAVAGEEFSQSALLTSWSDPGGWTIVAAAVMGTMLPPLILLSWRMKQQVSVGSIKWNLEVREIRYSEFEHLLKEYTKEYSHLQSRLDIPLVLLDVGAAVSATILPLIIVIRFEQGSGYAPHVFAFLLLVFGLGVLRTVYLAVPNDATSVFPVIKPDPLRAAVDLLEDTVGVSWAGVRLSIGESSGYYTLESPRAIGRIEGIESSAWIEVQTDKAGTPASARAKLTFDSGDLDLIGPPFDRRASLHDPLKELVVKCIEEYVKAKGRDEILDELMEELGMVHATTTGTSSQFDFNQHNGNR
jgi:hypothetical protein